MGRRTNFSARRVNAERPFFRERFSGGLNKAKKGSWVGRRNYFLFRFHSFQSSVVVGGNQGELGNEGGSIEVGFADLESPLRSRWMGRRLFFIFH